jgi:hypothetical protein
MGTADVKVHRVMLPVGAIGTPKCVQRLSIPRRADLVVKFFVEGEKRDGEGITGKRQLQAGMYLAGTMTRVKDGYGVTSILNATEEDLEMDEPVMGVRI